MELIDILESHLDSDSFIDTLKIDRLRQDLLIFVHLTHIADNSVRLVIRDLGIPVIPLVTEYDRESGVQVSCLVQTGSDFCRRETHYVKNFGIGKEVDTGTRLFCFSHNRKKTVHKFQIRLPLSVAVMMNSSVTLYFDIQIRRQGVHNRRADAVKSAGCLIGFVVELSSGMKRRIYKALCRHTLFVHSDRDTAPVITHRA